MDFSRKIQKFWTKEGFEDSDPLYLTKQSLQSHGEKVLDLTISNPTVVGLEFPAEVVRHALGSMDLSSYQPDPQGDLVARHAISEYYKETGRIVPSESLFLTSGTSEAYSFLFSLICNPGDEILVPSPSYPLFGFLGDLNGVEIRSVPISPKRETIEFANWENQISSRSKILILVNPNNPTGRIFSRNEMESIFAFCRTHKLVCIVDEVFRDYSLNSVSPDGIPEIPKEQPPVFYLNGISKVLALPQWKLSWIEVIANEIDKPKIFSGLGILADTYLSVNTPIQKALPELFLWRKTVQSRIQNRTQRNFNMARSILGDGWNVHSVQSGWALVLEYKGDWIWNQVLDESTDSHSLSGEKKTDLDLAMVLLKNYNLYFHSGEMFGFSRTDHQSVDSTEKKTSGGGRFHQRFLVASLLTEPEIWEEALVCLQGIPAKA